MKKNAFLKKKDLFHISNNPLKLIRKERKLINVQNQNQMKEFFLIYGMMLRKAFMILKNSNIQKKKNQRMII